MRKIIDSFIINNIKFGLSKQSPEDTSAAAANKYKVFRGPEVKAWWHDLEVSSKLHIASVGSEAIAKRISLLLAEVEGLTAESLIGSEETFSHEAQKNKWTLTTVKYAQGLHWEDGAMIKLLESLLICSKNPLKKPEPESNVYLPVSKIPFSYGIPPETLTKDSARSQIRLKPKILNDLVNVLDVLVASFGEGAKITLAKRDYDRFFDRILEYFATSNELNSKNLSNKLKAHLAAIAVLLENKLLKAFYKKQTGRPIIKAPLQEIPQVIQVPEVQQLQPIQQEQLNSESTTSINVNLDEAEPHLAKTASTATSVDSIKSEGSPTSDIVLTPVVVSIQQEVQQQAASPVPDFVVRLTSDDDDCESPTKTVQDQDEFTPSTACPLEDDEEEMEYLCDLKREFMMARLAYFNSLYFTNHQALQFHQNRIINTYYLHGYVPADRPYNRKGAGLSGTGHPRDENSGCQQQRGGGYYGKERDGMSYIHRDMKSKGDHQYVKRDDENCYGHGGPSKWSMENGDNRSSHMRGPLNPISSNISNHGGHSNRNYRRYNNNHHGGSGNGMRRGGGSGGSGFNNGGGGGVKKYYTTKSQN